MSKLVSVITPTAERARYLQGAYQLLQQQSYPHWEWLVYDTSLHPSSFHDERVVCIQDDGIVSIGEKRNRLVELAKGDLIVHFDDDDYYAPSYLENVVKRLGTADFFTMASWFSYDTKTAQYYYWDTEQSFETRYILNALSGTRIREIQLGPYLGQQEEQLNVNGKTGFGFTFAYRKEVLNKCRFPDLDFAEDHHFFREITKNGFQVDMPSDQKGYVIHMIHDSNTSTEYPQYRIPHFLAEPLFPAFAAYRSSYHEN